MKSKYLPAILAALFLILALAVPALAAESAGGGYLSGYSEVDPRPTATSWWSTLAYLLSLFAVFAFVVLMAYLASRFLGKRFGGTVAARDGRILSHLPLGPNRFICVVEIAESVFMLGVTEHSITLLREITDEAEIERLHQRELGSQSGALFSDQLSSIEDLARRIPSMFRNGPRR